jgi:DNA-binding winged helix-turn-helix (wHTH) protein/Flp pilus assembly protein TadD
MHMTLEARSAAVLSFGVFEVDVRAGELRKQGVRIKLQDQPFHVLIVLLQRPGEVVTREELRSRIWPEDTFVDFDNSLNTAINKLREALRDSADNSRFIETLPRRGYRFIASVTEVDGSTRGTAAGVSAAAPTRSRKIFATVAVVMLAGGIAGGLIWRARQARRLTDKDTIVLADFTNTTGEPVFDDALKQALRVQLEQSPFLNVLSDQQVNDELRLMGRSSEQPFNSDTARDLCQRLGSKAILLGSIARLGTHYAIGLNAVNCHTGDGLASEQVEADGREHVLKTLGESATRMRKKLGESLGSIEKYDAPVEQATTASLEALQAYSLGIKAFHSKGDNAGLPFFQRSVELDPKFAMAYGRLGVTYYNLGESTLGSENIREAYKLRQNVSQWERWYIESHYYGEVTGEVEKAAQVYELWQQIYPQWNGPHDNLSGVYSTLGRHEEALKEAREAMRLRADIEDNYVTLSFAYINLNRWDEAAAVLRRAEEHGLGGEQLSWFRYQVAFLKNDVAEMERSVENAASGRGPLDLIGIEGIREARRGHIRKARELWRQALESAGKNGAAEPASVYEDNAGMVEAYLGNREEARADVEAGQKLNVNRYAEEAAAFALALAGDVEGAEKLIADLNQRWPMDSLVERYWLPTIRAALALDSQNAEKAIDELRTMGSYEMSAVGQLHPVYLRGRAYLMLRDGRAAKTEFQKIIDSPGLVMENPVGTLAHLGLARAYALQGDTAKSRAAYHDFFTLWKDSDPDIPVLREAQAEYAKLQ